MASLNPPQDRSVADSEVCQALDVVVRSRVLRFLPVVAFVYLLRTVVNEGSKGFDANPLLAVIAAVVCCALVWLIRRPSVISDRRVQPLVFVILMVILATCLAQQIVTPEMSQLPILLLLLLAGAGTLLSRRWFAAFTSVAALGWTLAGLGTPPSIIRTVSALAVLLTGAFAYVALRARLRRQSEVQRTRLWVERLEAQAQETRQRAELAIDGSRDGLWYWELESGNFHFSPHWAALLGYAPGELETNVDEWFSRVHPGYAAELKTEIANHLQGSTDRIQHEHRLRRKDGTYVWVTARGTAVRAPEGKAIAVAGTHADVSSIMALETRVLDDTFHDKLTSLPNRQFFIKHLELAMERSQRADKPNGLFAVMFLDLDRFKVVNDSMGHLVGDQLLIAVAGRLRNCARENDIVARFGGDEFVVLLNPVRDTEEAVTAAGRFRRALSEPFQIDGREVTSGATLGIVLSNQNAKCTEDYLRYADMAMYHAKAHSKGDVQLFNQEMTVKATQLCDLQNDLARAVYRRELLLHYQPLVSIESGKICGAEALIRWRRGDGRVLLPGEFISIAEEMGLIGDIGEWALRTACAQNSAWQRAGLPPLRVAVNLSAQQLGNDFPGRVVSILEETRLSSRWLELELTESALMDSLDLAPAALEQLSKNGIRIAIDDFGTGYSSLNYLRRYNFQALKMDRCFVGDIVSDKRAGAIAKGLISLAHNLDLSVVAEGVEHRDQLNFLRAENCDAVQGYLASTPVAPEAFTRLLQTGSMGERLLHDPSVATWAPPQRELEAAVMIQ